MGICTCICMNKSNESSMWMLYIYIYITHKYGGSGCAWLSPRMCLGSCMPAAAFVFLARQTRPVAFVYETGIRVLPYTNTNSIHDPFAVYGSVNHINHMLGMI